MITNFEELTQELSEIEIVLIDVVKEFLLLHDKTKPVKSYRIQDCVNDYCKDRGINYKLHDSRLRKMINALRCTSELPVIGTSRGYFVSYDKQIIASQVDSLCQRANSIANCAKGLQNFL
jgi:hypothetical protein